MKKYLMFLMCLVCVSPLFCYAKLGVDEPVPWDDCSYEFSIDKQQCIVLRAEILDLKLQIMELQIQTILARLTPLQ